MVHRFDESDLMAQLVSYGPFLETAGQVASDPTQDIQGQTRQCLASIERVLALGGATKSDLTRIQIWLANIDDFDAMNVVYREWLDGLPKPGRACVGSALVAGGYLIEVQAFAYRA